MPLKPGSMVGGYRILRQLGSGGMGAVYLGQHPTLPRVDAVKILNSDLSRDPEFRSRFEREANLAAGLDHPNIVSVYNRGESDGHLWIAMQYVDGTDADLEVQRGPARMTPPRALRIVTEVGKGLDFAHRRGLLHRDVKPANFLLAKADEDEPERVLLTDFGVAKSNEDQQNLTATGRFVATVAYAPPEQLAGGDLDNRADVYSLACSLYKLLTGENPFPSPTPAAVIMAHLQAPPPRPTSVRPDLPPAIDDVFEIAMAKNPADRFATCREFTSAATAALQTGSFTAPIELGKTTPYLGSAQIASREANTVPRPERGTDAPARGRKKAPWLVGGALVAVLVLVGGFLLLNRNDDPVAPPDNQALLAQARHDNPAFDAKTVFAVNYGGPNQISIVLDPSKQANFLKDIGFRYSENYRVNAGESSPRTITATELTDANFAGDFGIVFRTDPQAANGGFGGLPPPLLNGRLKLIVVDAPATVAAFQNWNDADSTKTLVNGLVPVIAKTVK